MKTFFHHFQIPGLTFFCLPIILAGCANDPSTLGAQNDPAVESSTVVTNTVPPATPGGLITNRMSLLASEWQTLTGQFTAHYRTTSGAAINDTQVEIPWSAFDQLIQETSGEQRGVLFHYGLENGAFRLGLSFVTLKDISENNTEFEYPAHGTIPVHPFLEGEFKTPLSYANWKKNYVSAPLPITGRYFDSIELRRTEDAKFEKVVFGSDPQFEIMPYELEIRRLYTENQASFGDNDVFLVVTCASEYAGEEKSYVHKLCLHMRLRSKSGSATVTDLLDESTRTQGSEFKMHGGDLGNLCPPKCKKYAVRQAR